MEKFVDPEDAPELPVGLGGLEREPRPLDQEKPEKVRLPEAIHGRSERLGELLAGETSGPAQLREPGHPDGDVLLLQHFSAKPTPAAGRLVFPMNVKKV